MNGLLVGFLSIMLLPAPTRAADAHDVEAVIDVLHEVYGDELEKEQLYRAALTGVAEELNHALGRDGHTVVDTTEKKALETWLDGHRDGIAAEFSIVPGQGVVITEVYREGPAHRAGIQVGDLVVAIDNRPFTGLPSELILAITGAVQSPEVILDVRRPEGLRRIAVTRGPWQLDTARSFQHNDVTVLKLPFFGPSSARSVATALADHPAETPLVIDLRTNEGGRPESMVDVASLFLPAGRPALLVKHPDGGLTTHRAQTGTVPPPHAGLVILIGPDTAGTAEAFAAALQTEAGAILVGSPSSGHAWLPQWIEVSENLFLRAMVDQMHDPGGRSWASKGLVPDVLSQPVGRSMPVPPGELPPDVQLDVAAQIANRSSHTQANGH